MEETVLRITPAYAGKRERTDAGKGARRDHPRLRGEKQPLVERPEAHIGSPPLTRGKVRFARGLESHAGDHPRLRGEKSTENNLPARSRGSPPLTRGKVK